MSILSIQVPFPVFQNRDGQPLENGYIWIGEANLNPQTNPVVAYYDAALTIVAAQPLRTLNGYVSRAGTPAQVYVDGVDFSILVQDSKGSMVYNFPNGTGISPNACGVEYIPPFTGGVPYPVCEKLEQTVSVKDFGAVGDGLTDDTAAFNLAIATGSPVYVPEGTYKTNSVVTSPRRIYSNGASFTGSNTIDPYPAFGEGVSKSFATGNDNCIIGISDNNNPPSTMAFPTGVTGYGKYTNAGNTVFGIFGRADAYAAGCATNEFNSFNYAGAPSTALPPNRGFGTTEIVPVAVTVAAGGDYPSCIGIQIAKEGSEPQSFRHGIYMNFDACVETGLFIDAFAGSTHTAIIAKHSTPEQAIRAIGVGVPVANGAWFDYQDGNGNITFSIKQDGHLAFPTAITQSTVGVAGAASTLPSNPNGYLKVEIGGVINLIPYYTS